MITILHVILDNKFNVVINQFESDSRLINKKALILPSKSYCFSHIQDANDIKLLYGRKKIKQYFLKEEYDVVFFHSLGINRCSLLSYIPRDKKIIWWAWGWELYDSFYGLKPLIELELYKPKTLKYLKDNKTFKILVKDKLKEIVLRPYYYIVRNKALQRIDFFLPVLPIEYSLLFQNSKFHAEEFSFPINHNKKELSKPNEKDANGAILIGNSATYTMNHLDVLEILKTIDLKERTIIMPLNYGDAGCSDIVKDALKKTTIKSIILEDFLTQKDYFDFIDSCSYAIFGMMRQQAMGNVYYCLEHGIKVFLYKDSIPYRFLKSIGVVVFSIEDDLTLEALQTPVIINDTLHNRALLEINERERNVLYEKCIAQIENELKSN